MNLFMNDIICNCRDTITASFSGASGKGAVLTTHAMEEADALCTRLGIMVGGELK